MNLLSLHFTMKELDWWPWYMNVSALLFMGSLVKYRVGRTIIKEVQTDVVPPITGKSMYIEDVNRKLNMLYYMSKSDLGSMPLN